MTKKLNSCIPDSTISAEHLAKQREYKRKKQYKFITIRTLFNNGKKKKSTVHATIRRFGREWNKNLLNLPCARCNYDKYVELAHIKSIHDYEDSAILGDINSPTNVIQLCPNCHWEFDNEPRDTFKALLESLGKTYSEY